MSHDLGAMRPYLDQLVHKNAWDPAALSLLIDEFHGATRARAAGGAAGWHGASDIQTMSGLDGRFLWAENPLEPAQMRFSFAPGHVGFQGEYAMSRFGLPLEHGTFYSVPNNPAIGWAGITLVPASGTGVRSTVVSGMLTDNEWRIEVMLLNKLGPRGPVQPAFAGIRMP